MTNGEEVAPPAPEAVGEGGGGESMLHGSVGSLGGASWEDHQLFQWRGAMEASLHSVCKLGQDLRGCNARCTTLCGGGISHLMSASMIEHLINVHDTLSYLLFDYICLFNFTVQFILSYHLHHPILIVHLVSQRAVISAV